MQHTIALHLFHLHLTSPLENEVGAPRIRRRPRGQQRDRSIIGISGRMRPTAQKDCVPPHYRCSSHQATQRNVPEGKVDHVVFGKFRYCSCSVHAGLILLRMANSFLTKLAFNAQSTLCSAIHHRRVISKAFAKI